MPSVPFLIVVAEVLPSPALLPALFLLIKLAEALPLELLLLFVVAEVPPSPALLSALFLLVELAEVPPLQLLLVVEVVGGPSSSLFFEVAKVPLSSMMPSPSCLIVVVT